MAAGDFIGGGVYALRHEALQRGLQGAVTRGDDVLARLEAILRGHNFMPFPLKRRDQFVKARAVNPDAVGEHDAPFDFWFSYLCPV